VRGFNAYLQIEPYYFYHLPEEVEADRRLIASI
jgi:hypothetical protein